MKPERLNQAIAVMTRAKEAGDVIRMVDFQQSPPGQSSLAYSEQELHACGNTACFAGYMALAPEFAAASNEHFTFCRKKYSAAPTILSNDPGGPLFADASDALAAWFETSDKLIDILIFECTAGYTCDMGQSFQPLYGKPWKDIRADDVIKVLTDFRDKGIRPTLLAAAERCETGWPEADSAKYHLEQAASFY